MNPLLKHKHKLELPFKEIKSYKKITNEIMAFQIR
jgi:hypothetical protein